MDTDTATAERGATGPATIRRDDLLAQVGQTIEASFDRVDMNDVDTLLHVGGSLGFADMVEPLEARFGKPVISVLPATYWFALRTLGIQDPIPGFGRLLLKPEIG